MGAELWRFKVRCQCCENASVEDSECVNECNCYIERRLFVERSRATSEVSNKQVADSGQHGPSIHY